MKRAVTFGYYGVLTVLILVALLFAATFIPVPGAYDIKIVQSGSMEPAIDTGSIVVVRPASGYEVGDIITFGENSPDHVPTTHRITAVEVIEGTYRYTTKGDANDTPDPQTVPESDVIGEVIFSVPYAGYILSFARQPLGFILLIILPAAIVIIDEMRVIYRELVQKKSNTHT